MILKTSCDKCVFEDEEKPGCKIGRDIFVEGNLLMQRTIGLCPAKREEVWVKHIDRNIDLKDMVIDENQSLCLIVLSEDADIKTIQKTVDSASGLIKEVIVAAVGEDSDKIKKNIDFISNLGLHWKYKMIANDANLSDNEIVDQCSQDIQSSLWFLPIKAGDEVDEIFIQSFISCASDLMNSYILFYSKNPADFSVIRSRAAFLSMEGNSYEHWIDKVIRFDNWKDVCKQIDQQSV